MTWKKCIIRTFTPESSRREPMLVHATTAVVPKAYMCNVGNGYIHSERTLACSLRSCLHILWMLTFDAFYRTLSKSVQRVSNCERTQHENPFRVNISKTVWLAVRAYWAQKCGWLLSTDFVRNIVFCSYKYLASLAQERKCVIMQNARYFCPV